MAGAERLARVVRSGAEEAVHVGHVAIADAEGALVASAGDPGRVCFARSASKPIQAAVSLRLIAGDLSDREVAVMCASHNAELPHLQAVAALLARAGLGFGALRCPPELPLDPRAESVPERRPEFHDCSGKHAGMILACVRAGLDRETYPWADHPIQREVGEAITTAAGAPPDAIGVDGCGVPVHAYPLARLAAMYARLTHPERLGLHAEHAGRALGAMIAEPYFVAGRDRFCTALMEAIPGMVVKVGAEGLVCAGAVGLRLGVALKVEDGSGRARGPALARVLRLLGVIDQATEELVLPRLAPPVLGGGHPVGAVETLPFDLTRP